MTLRGSRPPVRGTIAVQFALLAFGLFAVAAVVIDLRLAALTQQQMQAAADGAALEGLGRRDDAGYTGQRRAARERVALAFDDDLDPDNGDPMNVGMGPDVRLVGGVGGDNALARISVGGKRVVDPDLQLNLQNKAWGDFVGGTFDETDLDHDEYANYSRTDFTPSAAAVPDAPAVLVRLRRTTNRTELDAQPGTSSNAPPIPLLFGMGSLVREKSGSDYNVRSDGVSLRAASIAAERRALTVSGPGPGNGYPGLQRFVLLSTGVPNGPRFPPPGQQFPPPGHVPGPTVGKGRFFPPPGITFPRKPQHDQGGWDQIWDDMDPGDVAILYVDDDGYLHADAKDLRKDKDKDRGKDKDKDEDVDRRDPVVGYAATLPGGGEVVTTVGEIPVTTAAPDPHLGFSYVPIVRSMGDYFRVIGFGSIRVSIVDPGPRRIRIEKLASRVATDGVSAVSRYALEALAVLPGLRAAHAQFPDPVTAPVLVR